MRALPGLLLAVAVASITTTAASAYHLHPKNISARLRGTLTFYPSEQKPFNCKVTMYLKTKGFIKSVKLGFGKRCEGVRFVGLPWVVGVGPGDSGQIGNVGFFGGGSDCSEGIEVFNDNKAGIWTLPANGQCLSGTLTSSPPVTIRQ